ncbi:MAG: gliding motility-associated C-terminal domain-containing protein, partial [Bacteroidales bacterium]|nr:gliding motility-associated C-terminal domain-containing protein [Bacteroidales bacterium]
ASSVFVDLVQQEASLLVKWRNNVPWDNFNYEVYRSEAESNAFNLLGETDESSFVDKTVVNGNEYCYFVKSFGQYSLPEITDTFVNLSQQVCKLSVDTLAPCAPELKAESLCDSLYNLISWSMPDSCNYDVNTYTLYYTPYLDGKYEVIATIASDALSFRHYPENTMAGCYYINASDSFGNVSENSSVVCVDACSYYELPNVFTPNGDNVNDYYHPVGEYRFVDKVDMTIMNRWGQTMFVTNDPDIMWDGRNRMTGEIVMPGVYFYVCDVYEQRLTGLEVRHLKGFIHVFSSENFAQPNE